MIRSEARKIARTAAHIALQRKALNIRILDVSGTCDYADYFIIVSATSPRHARALADALVHGVELPQNQIEGYSIGEWVLLDFTDIVVHIFHEPVRAYYNFDKLWGHVARVTFPELKEPSRGATAARTTL